MNRSFDRLADAGWLKLAFACFLIGAFLVMTGGELFAGVTADDCEDHCEESCHGCGDCLLCLPSLHMIVAPDFHDTPTDQCLNWTLASVAAQMVRHPADDIDHPPQNLL